ncbi:MAG TPA: carbohydrate ABC transporter substrate-binding protein [Gammaproteobacteria bacterium]|nr:carbohydrate ABC transporter substrate-binding protein [Gammaproteobacteria bacterium]
MTLRTALAEERSIRFWHWWNSAGEVKNIEVLNKYLTKNNLVWEEQAAQHSSSNLYLTRVKKQLQSQLPDAAMMDSSETHKYAESFNLLPLDDIAQEQNWDEVIPLAIQERAKHQGHWVSAPLNSHSTNWLWINKDLFLRLNISEPQTWNDLIAMLDKAKALGIPALASMRDDWEQALLFELTLMSTGGLGFYRRLFFDQVLHPSDRSIVAKSLLRLKQLTSYYSDTTDNLSWDQSTAQLAKGNVLVQVHGSWVNSELSSLDAEANIDYMCLRFPETQGAYIFNSDHVVFFKAPYNDGSAQKKLARILLDKDFQRELSIANGASPARVDITTEGFNHCSKKSIYDLRMANMRRAVMPSINNKALEKAVASFLQQHTSLRTAVEQVLHATLEEIQSPPSKSS